MNYIGVRSESKTIYSNHNLTFNLQSRGGSAAFALKLDIFSNLPKKDLWCPAEAAVDGPVRPPQYLTLKGPQRRTEWKHAASVRLWMSWRPPRSSSTAAAAQVVGMSELRRRVQRRLALNTTSRGSFTSSGMSGPASRGTGRSGRWSGPSCRYAAAVSAPILGQCWSAPTTDMFHLKLEFFDWLFDWVFMQQQHHDHSGTIWRLAEMTHFPPKVHFCWMISGLL